MVLSFRETSRDMVLWGVLGFKVSEIFMWPFTLL